MLRNSITLLSCLLLAAHELRSGNSLAFGFWLMASALACSPWRRKHLILAVLLLCGSWLWAETTLHLIQQRLAHHLPWLRLSMILGSVTLICLTGAIFNMIKAWQERKH